MVHAVDLKFNSHLALKSIHEITTYLNINNLHNNAEPMGPEQSPTNHTCYGIYFPAILRCYRPLKLTQLGSSFGLASV